MENTDLSQFQEELAKTYFTARPSKENHFTQSQPSRKTKKIQFIIPSITLGLIGIFILLLFIFNRIIIHITVMPTSGRTALQTASLADKGEGKAIYLNQNGEFNRGLIKNVLFYENADIESSWGKELVVLANEVGSKKAILGINFNNPVNMQWNLFCFYAKGRTGGENLRVSLRDDKNNICHSKTNELRSSWQQFVIDIAETRDFLDPERITHIDFEVNPEEKQNSNQSIVYFKDMHLLERGR